MPKWTEEQQLAIDKENTNIIVSAGAGSGKTAVLTARVIRKLKDNISINQLLILTFTKKAAHEMKERIRLEILKDDSLKKELNYIDSSYITTFDSFALSMVKKYSYLLNINKNIKIADSSIIYLKKKKILDDIFDNFYKENNSLFLKLVADFTIKDDNDLKKYILDINDKLDLKYDKISYLNRYIDNYYSDLNINSLIDEYNKLLINKIKKIDLLLTEFSNFVETDYYLEVQNNFLMLLQSTNYDDIKKNVVVKIPNLPKNSSKEAKDLKKEITEMLTRISELVRFSDSLKLKECLLSTKDYVSIIIDIIKKLDLEINKFKNTNFIYEFNDVSKMAIDILKNNNEVLLELKNSFKEIMIDEYQDTSDLQEEFISLIENNNVYMVGDIKQSIYRFRNANPYLFKNKYDMYSKNLQGFKIDLTKNFRSRMEVIDNINLLFSLIMNDDLGGADYKKTHRMIFGNNIYFEKGKTEQNNNIEIFDYEYDSSLGYTKEEIEIFFIATDIKNKINNKYKIFAKNDNVLRDAKYSDFVILLDRSTNFDLYKKIFEYMSIPMTKYTATNITNEIEILLIKNILKLILCVKDKKYDIEFKYAFMSIARSYLFQFSDEEIFSFFYNNNFKDNKLYEIVYAIASKIDYLSLNELISIIIDNFEFYSKQVLIGDVKNRINRLQSIIDIFNNLAEIGYDVYEAYEYLENLIEEKYKLEIKETEEDNDSVKIMTIHASKGLEFPICYFASLHSTFNIRELNEKFLYNNKYGIVAPYFDEGIGKTFVKDLVKEEYIKEEISEKIRLFYVALTRAKEKMIVVTSYKNNNRKRSLENCRSFLDMLSFVKENMKDYIFNVDLSKINLTKNYNLVKEYNYRENIEHTDLKISFFELDILNNILNKERISKETKDLLDKDNKEKMEFGKYIHKVLEYIDFKNFDISLFSIPEFYKTRIDKFINLVNKEEIINVYKEYEFSYINNDIYEHGIIDLILEYDNHIKIIDYKLKNIKDGDYRRQIEKYKEYLSNKTNKKIDTYLFSIIDGTLERID